MWNPFKKAVDTIACLNPLRFSPGEKVVLINDPKQETYIVEHLNTNKNGIPEISRGPMGQLPPSLSYLVRSEKWGGLSYFRSDSLEAKSMTAVERKIAEINQEIKEHKITIIDYEHEIKEEQRQIELLERELSYWQKEPEHVV
jgi:predicted mannosyl-3-phosphoglycerate phosphatase (HAD superfamily)